MWPKFNLFTKIRQWFARPKRKKSSFHRTLSELDKYKLADAEHIPHILRECVEYLQQDDNIKHRFILEEPGNAKLVEKVHKRISAGMSANFTDPNVASDILKQFLVAMPSFLISHDIYWHVTDQKFSVLSDFRKKSVLMKVVHETVPSNRASLCFLMDFLHRVKQVEENQMTAYDLAEIFAPIVIKSEGRQTAEFRMEAVKIMTFFIDNYDEIISTVLGFEALGNIEMLKIHGSVMFYV